MSNLFKPKADLEKRATRIVVCVTKDEQAKVKAAARSRQMDVAEFARRAMLGRRADVDRVTEAVLALSAITREIRRIHATMVERGIDPPRAEMLPVLLEARAAMLRIVQASERKPAADAPSR
jgi:hypothetical protein